MRKNGLNTRFASIYAGSGKMPDTNPKYEGRRYNFSEPLKWYVKIYFR